MKRTCILVWMAVLAALVSGHPGWALGPDDLPSGLGPVSGALKARLEAPVSPEDAHKSPALAFGLSLILPGAGQAYEGRWAPAALFFGAELVSWTGWYVWRDKGKDKEREYQTFADDHWSLDRYQAWRDNYRARYDTTWWTHSLPDRKDQEYYEMIGKYDQFAAGWEDYPSEWLEDPPEDNRGYADRDTLRSKYEDLRAESNKYLKRAGYMMGVVLVNRVLSAIVALRGAEEEDVQVQMVPRREGPVLAMFWRF
ncbi:MAG: hypothetical protein DRP95_02590 [Candidatus Latescibacterota bacterium]|nr:MAG: hypothetical protein DRP95_02590 [Candidatus Latescibacterota bacterium]